VICLSCRNDSTTELEQSCHGVLHAGDRHGRQWIAVARKPGALAARVDQQYGMLQTPGPTPIRLSPVVDIGISARSLPHANPEAPLACGPVQ
jgi:hypothetical protein